MAEKIPKTDTGKTEEEVKKSIEYTKKAFAPPTPKQLEQQARARAKGGLTESGVRQFETRKKQLVESEGLTPKQAEDVLYEQSAQQLGYSLKDLRQSRQARTTQTTTPVEQRPSVQLLGKSERSDIVRYTDVEKVLAMKPQYSKVYPIHIEEPQGTRFEVTPFIPSEKIEISKEAPVFRAKESTETITYVPPVSVPLKPVTINTTIPTIIPKITKPYEQQREYPLLLPTQEMIERRSIIDEAKSRKVVGGLLGKFVSGTTYMEQASKERMGIFGEAASGVWSGVTGTALLLAQPPQNIIEDLAMPVLFPVETGKEMVWRARTRGIIPAVTEVATTAAILGGGGKVVTGLPKITKYLPKTIPRIARYAPEDYALLLASEGKIKYKTNVDLGTSKRGGTILGQAHIDQEPNIIYVSPKTKGFERQMTVAHELTHTQLPEPIKSYSLPEYETSNLQYIFTPSEMAANVIAPVRAVTGYFRKEGTIPILKLPKQEIKTVDIGGNYGWRLAEEGQPFIDLSVAPEFGQKTLFGEQAKPQTLKNVPITGWKGYLQLSDKFYGISGKTKYLPEQYTVLDLPQQKVVIESVEVEGVLPRFRGMEVTGYKPIGEGQMVFPSAKDRIFGTQLDTGKPIEIFESKQVRSELGQTYVWDGKKWVKVDQLRTVGKRTDDFNKLMKQQPIIDKPYGQLTFRKSTGPKQSISNTQQGTTTLMRKTLMDELKVVDVRPELKVVTKSTRPKTEMKLKTESSRAPEIPKHISPKWRPPMLIVPTSTMSKPKKGIVPSIRIKPIVDISSTGKLVDINRGSSVIPVVGIKPRLGEDVGVKPTLVQIEPQLEQPIQITEQIQTTRTVTPTSLITVKPKPKITPTPEIPKPKPPIIPLPKDSQPVKTFGTIMQQNKGYDVYLKNKLKKIDGKRITKGFSKINKQPLKQKAALGLLMKTADDFTNRSGFIQATTKKAIKSASNRRAFDMLKSKFRQSKNDPRVLVEKSRYAIDSINEKRGIPYLAAKLRRMKAI